MTNKGKHSVLVVDDEEGVLRTISLILSNEGYHVVGASSVDEFKEKIASSLFDLVITDLRMGADQEAGMKVLEEMKLASSDVPTIMLTAFGSVDSAIEAMRKGAFDYQMKPFKNDELKLVVRNAIEHKRLREENRTLLSQQLLSGRMDNLIGSSPAMEQMKDLIRKVAPLSSNVLLQGESGTGKEMVARALHAMSPRGKRPFVAINCGGIPETLLESELFGHVKGAFTGAVGDKKGLFEAAHGGTLFLDELETTTPMLQIKLLRVLDDRVVKPVGSTDFKTVDVRLISATNQDLEELIEKKEFREDLFYRLNVIPIHLPPLRQNPDDIILLMRHFVSTFSKTLDRDIKDISDEAMAKIQAYDWPGNVRELKNVIERAVALCGKEVIEVEDLPENLRQPRCPSPTGDVILPAEGIDLEKNTEDIEKSLIIQALQKVGHSQTKAAELLFVPVRALRYRLKKYGLDGGREKPSQNEAEE